MSTDTEIRRREVSDAIKRIGESSDAAVRPIRVAVTPFEDVDGAGMLVTVTLASPTDGVEWDPDSFQGVRREIRSIVMRELAEAGDVRIVYVSDSDSEEDAGEFDRPDPSEKASALPGNDQGTADAERDRSAGQR